MSAFNMPTPVTNEGNNLADLLFRYTRFLGGKHRSVHLAPKVFVFIPLHGSRFCQRIREVKSCGGKKVRYSWVGGGRGAVRTSRRFDICGRTDDALNADPVNPGQQPSKAGGSGRREIRTCATCGTKFSVTSDIGICPVCILLGSFGEESASGDSLLATSGTELGSAEAKHLSIVRRFENYEVMLDEDGKPIELGRGAMGVTYKAFDVDLRIAVTLKLISEKYVGDESAKLRFLREARAAAKVRHSNVASVFHLGRSSQGYFYAMEFVEGETLESLIKRSGRLEVKLALEILSQVAAGLAAVDDEHLVHRDIKPTNIIVRLKESDRITAKIIDLGLAKRVGDSFPESAISILGGFAGTPEFASPEQFAGMGVDIRSDLYSLGVTLWEMLTGQAPFNGSPLEVMYQHQRATLPLEQLKGVPQPVVVLVEVLLEKDPLRRFQSPAELLKALPKVTGAVEARRTIAHQSLVHLVDQRFGAAGTAIRILTNLRDVIGVRKVRMILWLGPMLAIGGGAILALTVSRPKGHTPQASRGFPPALTAPEKSIAVLPFESVSPNKDDLYFADGIQDEILSNLAKLSQLKVTSRTSVMTYRPGGNRDLRSIATALDVAHVLEGTVRREGSRVRITTELIDAQTDRTLWSESYDRDLTGIFAVQSEIAQTVVKKLRARLSPEDKQDMQEKPTDNLEAYDLFLQAQELIDKSTIFAIGDLRQNLLNAIELLEKATQKDGQFALAYCLIASAQDELYVHRNDDSEKLQRRWAGDAAINEALRLQPDLPEAHLRLASHLYMVYRDYERARVQLAIVQQALPNSSEALGLKGALDRRQGRWEESTKGLEKAVDLDPRNPILLGNLNINYFSLRRFGESERICDRLIELQPDKPIFKVEKATTAFSKTAELKRYRAVLDALWPLLEGDEDIAYSRLCASIYDRDWTAAKEILNRSVSANFPFPEGGALVPRESIELWIARLEGDHPKIVSSFAGVRDRLNQKVEENLEDASLLSALGLIDAALGRKEEAIAEARHATEMLPVLKDARDGPALACNLAVVYALTNEPDQALREIAVSIKTPGGIDYADLRLDPSFDSLRGNPTFVNLLAELSPHE
jgi:serine/threonine protein kinase/tetratricopeptide (TPR) repeat protein